VVVGFRPAVGADLAPSGSSYDAGFSPASPTLVVRLEASCVSRGWLWPWPYLRRSRIGHGDEWAVALVWPAASVPGAPSAHTIWWGKTELTGRSPYGRLLFPGTEKSAPETLSKLAKTTAKSNSKQHTSVTHNWRRRESHELGRTAVRPIYCRRRRGEGSASSCLTVLVGVRTLLLPEDPRYANLTSLGLITTELFTLWV